MSRYYRGGGVALKPENSLKRAEELIGVGQKSSALQTLHDTITNKRYQRNWTKALEQVMYKYVDLAVDMRQGRKLKDALINYRNTCQQVNVGSLEDVVKYLVDASSERAEAARAEAQARLDDLEDLEAEASPEELVLSYVSGEKSADRTDREVVAPWFKFLWEVHRHVLDVLRNNSRLEALYATAAGRAFAFCLQYKRTTEFRRLCDILRNHLSTLIRYRDQVGRDRTDLSVSSTWELYVDVRFDQLRTACELELWAEAFRTIEDIRGLVTLAPKGIKAPKPHLMATYYARLTQIFTRSEARLYNAYAWYRLFTFSRTYNKNLTPDDISFMASNVVLSALSVLPYDVPGVVTAQGAEEAKTLEAERSVKMAAILGFNVDRRDGRALLSRAALLADIERKGLLQLVPAPVKTIYSALEGEFNPLQLCKVLAPLLETLPDLSKSLSPASAMALDSYVPYLQEVALTRAVRQLSEVYSVMKVSALSELAPFGFGRSEALIVDAIRAGYLQARFDHRCGTVNFGGQDLESDRVKSQLATVAKRLAKAAMLAAPEALAAQMEAEKTAKATRAALVASEENARALARKHIIEMKKEEAEKALLEREKEEAARRAEEEARAREAEERRIAAERVRREEERIHREMAEEEQARIRAELAARGKKIDEAQVLDVSALREELRREENVKEAEMKRKLARLAKQMDHLERAKREEEAPMRAQAAVERAQNEQAQLKEEADAAAAAHRQGWERDVALKKTVARMMQDVHAFAAEVEKRRASELEALRAQRRMAQEEARAARKLERDIARRREFVRRCRAEIEERRKAEEAAARKEEEEKARREAAERQRKLDEIAERQRQREAEIEAKIRGEKSAAGAPPPRTSGYVPPHRREGGAPPEGGKRPYRPPAARGGSRW